MPLENVSVQRQEGCIKTGVLVAKALDITGQVVLIQFERMVHISLNEVLILFSN